jgi:hypothetical protein
MHAYASKEYADESGVSEITECYADGVTSV